MVVDFGGKYKKDGIGKILTIEIILQIKRNCKIIHRSLSFKGIIVENRGEIR